jgi:hypothetical protein
MVDAFLTYIVTVLNINLINLDLIIFLKNLLLLLQYKHLCSKERLSTLSQRIRKIPDFNVKFGRD